MLLCERQLASPHSPFTGTSSPSSVRPLDPLWNAGLSGTSDQPLRFLWLEHRCNPFLGDYAYTPLTSSQFIISGFKSACRFRQIGGDLCNYFVCCQVAIHP